MSAGKIGALVLYAVLAGLALTQGGTQLGSIASWIIFGLIAVHTLEVVIFFKLCRETDGSMAGHLLQVFAFGYFHVKELKATSA
jgi:hypothetical protein